MLVADHRDREQGSQTRRIDEAQAAQIRHQCRHALFADALDRRLEAGCSGDVQFARQSKRREGVLSALLQLEHEGLVHVPPLSLSFDLCTTDPTHSIQLAACQLRRPSGCV